MLYLIDYLAKDEQMQRKTRFRACAESVIVDAFSHTAKFAEQRCVLLISSCVF